jgi:hypothetical protein
MKRRVLSIMGFLFWFWIYIPAFAENIQYTYDDLNRLTQVTYEDGTIINYTLPSPTHPPVADSLAAHLNGCPAASSQS